MLGNASASEVAKITKRARAVESSYLCQLERIGIINCEHVGRIKRFSILKKPLLRAYESFKQNSSNQLSLKQNFCEI
jgi:predicted transcriptional regulator